MAEADDGDSAARDHAFDPDAVNARLAALRVLPAQLEDLAALLRDASARKDGGDNLAQARGPGLRALGLVLEAAHELMAGIRLLQEEGRYYSAAALIRQLVEVEYLAWACCDDLEEASAWLTSSREKRLARWQPRHLRQRSGGRFGDEEYWLHCELGGHPTPGGINLLIAQANKATAPQVISVETLTHVARIWDYAMQFVAPIQSAHPVEGFTEASAVLARWRTVERLNFNPPVWPLQGL